MDLNRRLSKEVSYGVLLGAACLCGIIYLLVQTQDNALALMDMAEEETYYDHPQLRQAR
jgi:hypothetical protein